MCVFSYHFTDKTELTELDTIAGATRLRSGRTQ
jgi:hypothetical protein